MSKKKIIESLNKKSIAIWGLGREGLSTLNFIDKNCKNASIYLFDDAGNYNIPNVEKYNIIKSREELNSCDIIMKTPGISLEGVSCIDLDKITSQTDLFLNAFSTQIIGVTGTKGKSTTSSLIYKILNENLGNTIFVGNIGIPCFDKVDDINDDTKIVYELSCHQLQFIHKAPHIAVLLNIYQDHLDHYGTFEKYSRVKKNIYSLQSNNDVIISPNKHLDLEAVVSTKIIIDDDIKIANRLIKTPKGEIEILLDDTNLIGDHNIYNISISYFICHDLFGISNADFKKSLKTFKGLPHRLELVRKFNNINYIDDSISTTCETTIAAIKSLKNVNTLILGGMDRGIDYKPLIDYLISSNVKNIILLPGTADRIYSYFNEETNDKKIIKVKNMQEAVDIANEITLEGECLLSPSAASYGYYKNFEERGDDFKRIVNDLK